ncbi:NACHT, LRR and PYD domains-containing protein 14-like [Cololabis saira]|uniref:NACHT, LRR and PYD domains-containing protein 14-like n=1 Tax=Cololabis saira TaxID=129043 RepID=UPI002AD2F3DD|nr:NACHT, LRR and PYD domains-containing protein 14-like [Cololabis saira]
MDLFSLFNESIEPEAEHGDGSDSASAKRRKKETSDCLEKILEKIRPEFVNRSTEANLKQLIDLIRSDGVLNPSEEKHILEKNQTTEDKARDFFDCVVKKGHPARRMMLKHLQSKDPSLCQDLDLRFDKSVRKELLETCQAELKSKLTNSLKHIFEGCATQGKSVRLKDIYTKPNITKGDTEEVKVKHEAIRTIITKGEAGIGKTLVTQKYSLDWAQGKDYKNIQLVFPFTFRDLNGLKERNISLVELVHEFFKETAEIFYFEEFHVVFVFDGLDECRLSLDFRKNKTVNDPRKITSVDVLLTNLIMGNLLPSAHLLITTRPAAANQIPPGCVDFVTEVRGFTDPQKEEYFSNWFRDKAKSSTIISHIKTSRSLHIMCEIPVFCRVTATVLEKVLKTREQAVLPKTLTEMYIHFLLVQTKQKKVKYDGGAETDPENRKMIESLGKLAFEQLQKGNLTFYEPDLRECGIDITEASVCSGVLTENSEVKDEYQDKVFCFVHLSVHEFLAALHVHLTFINSRVNLLKELRSIWTVWNVFGTNSTSFYQTAVDNALQSPNGHLDLFLRFLLGLSLETNEKLLRGLLTFKERSLHGNQQIVQYIKKKISEDLSAERSINLFHCLNELNDRSLVEDVQQSLRSGPLSRDKLSPAQWSALGFILLSSGEDLEVFDLKKYSASEEVLRRLLPVVKASKKVLLSQCKLSKSSCEDLSSVLNCPCSRVTELELSNNNLQDSAVKKLSVGLKSRHCNLEVLRLEDCKLSDSSCEDLSSVLSSQSSKLTQLDVSNNNLWDSGVKFLSDGLKSLHCNLEVLRLEDCKLSKSSCEDLSSVLSSQSSKLTQLDVSNNNLQASGMKFLSDGLKSRHCNLEVLRLSQCKLSMFSCEDLSSVLNCPCSRVTELELSNNNLQDSAVKKLSVGLKSRHCKLEVLRLEDCKLSKSSCADLSSVLSSQSSKLTQLDVSNNNLQDSGMKFLSDGLKSRHCNLEVLRLSQCKLSTFSCEDIASVLSSQSSKLTKLDLSNNNLQDSGMKFLSVGLKSRHCKLEVLRLEDCKLSKSSCADLSSVLSSKSSKLTKLELSNNNLEDSGGKILSDGLKSGYCNLKVLRLV